MEIDLTSTRNSFLNLLYISIKTYIENLGCRSFSLTGSKAELSNLSMNTSARPNTYRIIIADSEFLKNIPTNTYFRALSIHSILEPITHTFEYHAHLYQPVGPFELLNALNVVLSGITTESMRSETSAVRKSVSKSTSSASSTVMTLSNELMVLIVEGKVQCVWLIR